mmetsp:Transcript_24537/g.53390  ORF Transcript_24537/g.53390 Transcript_24537/m.53390 type:complete len:259 (-) Transcript_24537:12-788(-)
MPGDGGARHEDREGEHALLQSVQELADGVAVRVGVHLRPQLLAHQASNGGSGQAFDHGGSDVHNALLVEPLLGEELLDLPVQGANVGLQAILDQTLADEAKLGHSGGVVGVVEDLRSEDGDGEGVHLGLVEVLIRGEEELVGIFSNHEDKLLRQEINSEGLSLSLVTGLHHVQRTLKELEDGSEDRDTVHVEGRRHLASSLPSLVKQPGHHDNRGPSGEESGHGDLFLGEFAHHLVCFLLLPQGVCFASVCVWSRRAV